MAHWIHPDGSINITPWLWLEGYLLLTLIVWGLWNGQPWHYGRHADLTDAQTRLEATMGAESIDDNGKVIDCFRIGGDPRCVRR